MSCAVDTNVLIALWDNDPQLNMRAEEALDAASSQGSLLISGAVYAEMLAAPGRDQSMLNEFFESTGIQVDWKMSEPIWKAAGVAFRGYVARRRIKKELPRRILTDFLVGAHAMLGGHELLTLDQRIYGASFPKLDIREV